MIVAVGGRPNKLGCTGEELAVSSDDLFMLDHPPKKTLLVGASFIKEFTFCMVWCLLN